MARKGRKKRNRSGHYCWACDRMRANERFSGKGHARNVCRECMQLGPVELERRRALRDLASCFTCEGRVRSRSRKQLERFFHHPDLEIRQIARDMVWDSGDRRLAHEFLEEYSFDDDFLEHRSFLDPDSIAADNLSNLWIESGPSGDDAIRLAVLIGVWIESEPCPADLFNIRDLTGAWIESGGSPGGVCGFDDPGNTRF